MRRAGGSRQLRWPQRDLRDCGVRAVWRAGGGSAGAVYTWFLIVSRDFDQRAKQKKGLSAHAGFNDPLDHKKKHDINKITAQQQSGQTKGPKGAPTALHSVNAGRHRAKDVITITKYRSDQLIFRNTTVLTSCRVRSGRRACHYCERSLKSACALHGAVLPYFRCHYFTVATDKPHRVYTGGGWVTRSDHFSL